MFTGIVQAKGRVSAIERNAFGARLRIDGQGWPDPAKYKPVPGDSICISGVCLTVVETSGGLLAFDVIAETLAKTSLGDLSPGSAINLEPPVTANQPLGGHFMQGHVDGVGVVTDVYAGKDEWRVTVKPPADLMPYIIPKGSIAIDGISLTLAAVHEDTFEVALIPTTLEITTLGETEVGRRVNLEADIISKTVVHQLMRLRAGGDAGPGLTMRMLQDAGFVAAGSAAE
jgi:riboflavin synthase alpha subunit